MKEIKSYDLLGSVEVSFWGGGIGWIWLAIHTTKEGLKEIEKVPLQDFSQFGVESVDYANFEVFEKSERVKNGVYIKTETIDPIKIIEAGKSKLNRDRQIEKEEMFNGCYEDIYYKYWQGR